MSEAPPPINLRSPLDAMHRATIAGGVHTAQRRYDYSSDTLARLSEQLPVPDRLQKAVPRRQVDFLSGRHCAQHALHSAGFIGSTEISIGERGQPLWPTGFVGSISHCDGVAIAAVGQIGTYAGIGLDIERTISADVSREVGDQVATAAERSLGVPEGLSAECWLTLLFSGKESLFKALYPSVGTYFDFLDASVIRLDARAGMFLLQLHVALSPQHGPGSTYAVGFHREAAHVLTHCLLLKPTTGGTHE